MFVSITRLRIRGLRYIPAFAVMALRSALQAKAAEGNIGVTVLGEAHRAFWTRTIWTDERAMHAFIAAEPHRQTMRRISDWCDEAAVVHWTQDSPQPPSWDTAHQRMQRDGRPTTVRHPSAAQDTFTIAAPRVGMFSQWQLK